MNIPRKNYRVVIYSRGKTFIPLIEGKVKIKWERGFRAGTMEFNVVKDGTIDYHEGDMVTFSVDGDNVFKGYVFEKKRNKNQIIQTLCYDSIRYLKAKDTYQYESKSMSELLKKICSDRGLNAGSIEDTGYKVPKKIEQNVEYLKMLESAYNITLSQTGKLYTLFDEDGSICLKSPESMFVNYPVTYDNMTDFDYVTSIDRGSYNRVVVYITDDDGNLIDKKVKEDGGNIAKWGVLEYTVTTNNAEDIDNKAAMLLETLNRVYRSLEIKQAIGNIKVRAGSIIPVRMMQIGDINISSNMIVESVEHTFYDDYHFMDLNVKNKDVMSPGSGDGIIQDNPKEGYRGAGSSYTGKADSPQKQDMLNAAFSMLGQPYSMEKRGIGSYTDCSYFVWKCMKEAGYNVPQNAWTTFNMAQSGNLEPIPFSKVRAGDVGVRQGGAGGGHTVIALSQSEIIHSTPPAVTRSPMGKYASYQFYRPKMR